MDESSSRAARMSERQETDNEVWLQEVRNAQGKVTKVERRLSPIAWWDMEDIWVFLRELEEGKRQSYTDAVALSDAYRDGGNDSCVVVADMKTKENSKACGARFGCSLCTAVGRDKSLEAMLESDPKYDYLIPLNRLQRFLVDTQYDTSRRNWLGRTIQDDGYIAIAPDAYSPGMQEELLRYALTIDRDERIAAAKLGLRPRYQLVSEEQLIAIDATWSIQGYHARPFEAIHIWEDVYIRGKSYVPPEVDTSAFDKKIPKPRWLYVGTDWDCDPGFNPMYSGARHLMADFVGATESGGCMHNIELKDGRVVMAVEESDMLNVDSEGAALFFDYEVLESKVHHKYADADRSEAFRHYQMLGTIATSTKHLGTIDHMLRRAAWKARHGVFDMDVNELLYRSVSDHDRKDGIKCPPGQQTLSEILAERLEEEHKQREARAPMRMS